MFQEYAIEDIVRVGIAVVILFAGLFAILYILWGGFLMIISGGNEEKIKPAINSIRHAVLGVLFLLVVLFVAPIVINLFELPYGEYMKPSSVLQTISEISGKIFGAPMASPGFESDIENSDLPTSFDNL